MKPLTMLLLVLGIILSGGCASLRQFDSQVYGGPPTPLKKDVTVYVTFADAVTSSVTCGKKAFGPVGVLLPTHGCVVAERGEPIRMILPLGGPLRGRTHENLQRQSRRSQPRMVSG